MKFEEAFQKYKDGYDIGRRAWNGPATCVTLNHPHHRDDRILTLADLLADDWKSNVLPFRNQKDCKEANNMTSSLLKVIPCDKCDYVANTSDGQFITAERLVDLANDAVRASDERGKMICRLRNAIALLLPVGINQLHEISAVMQITGEHIDLSEDDEDEDNVAEEDDEEGDLF